MDGPTSEIPSSSCSLFMARHFLHAQPAVPLWVRAWDGLAIIATVSNVRQASLPAAHVHFPASQQLLSSFMAFLIYGRT